MCGIVGVWSSSERSKEALIEAVRRLGHRGPDDSGTWLDNEANLGLGFTRLSILDLSSAGRQPMHSACGRYVLVFNGEIYNHMELRTQLSADTPAWRGQSDTETLLACFSAWGVEKTLKSTVGMFALGLWDRKQRALVLARDRMGEKPLYYGYAGSSLVFASELKAISAFPEFSGEIDRGAISLLLRHNYIPAPHCIYRQLVKLPPGSWVEFSSNVVKIRTLPNSRVYWSAMEVALAGVANPLVFSTDHEATDSLEFELTRAIAGQMIADVPLGAFLSGGVDSSTVVALMQSISSRPVKTFSIGFHEGGYDEAVFARAVARHLGTDHTEIYVSSDDALSIIPKLSGIYDEPFSDSSQIPTYLVSQLARQHVTVSLSGDGGDEFFGGYSRYFIAARIWGTIAKIPRPFRHFLAAIIQALPPELLDQIYRVAAVIVPKKKRWQEVGVKLHKGAALLPCKNSTELYRGLTSHWDPGVVVLDGREPDTRLAPDLIAALPSFIEQMMLQDTISYLPDGILVKLDRAAMAVSLETRVPLIDHRIFEFAWRLPVHYKVRGGVGKWLLRQVLYKYVPRELIDRPKMGFGVPLGKWLRGPLRDWAESLLDESRLRQQGYFDPRPIRRMWLEHLSGSRDWQYHLWDVLMFQTWLDGPRQ